jgi:hypothetical protein
VTSRAGLEKRIRAICLDLPGVTEKLSHGAPAFFVGRQFLMLWIDGHHEHAFPHLWCAAPPGAQSELVTTEPERFSGHRMSADVDGSEFVSTAGSTGARSRLCAKRHIAASRRRDSLRAST